MGHTGLLRLYKVRKDCLRVQLQGKKKSQYPHCLLSIILQEISRIPPANKTLRLLYQVFVDWHDLEEWWDSYHSDGAVVRQVMVFIYEASRMAITYFTQSAKEDDNLLLVQDFVTWLVLRYNLEVKVINQTMRWIVLRQKNGTTMSIVFLNHLLQIYICRIEELKDLDDL